MNLDSQFAALAGYGPMLAWMAASTASVAVLLVLVALRRLVRNQYRKLLATEANEFMELPLGVLARTTLPFFIVAALFVGLKFLALPPHAGQVLNSAITIALFWQAGVWLSAAFLAWLDRKRRHSMSSDRAMVGSIGIIGLVVRGLIWTLVVLLTLDNLGVNITALVAGLGIGGVAVALALQNILGDLFASLAIAMDQPFVIGDALGVGEIVGTVETIGIKSTRLRSVSGEQVIISNADLLSSRVRNYGRMEERRVLLMLNVTYETQAQLLESVPGAIREIVEAQENARFERCHLCTFGAHSLDFECVYFVLSPDYKLHMDVRQSVNLAIFREFQKRGIEFAYPTQKLFMARASPLASTANDSLAL